MSLWQVMLKLRYAPQLKRRRRPIGVHQNPLGRFLRLRRPFGLLKRAESIRMGRFR